jgi:hypothetical protein
VSSAYEVGGDDGMIAAGCNAFVVEVPDVPHGPVAGEPDGVEAALPAAALGPDSASAATPLPDSPGGTPEHQIPRHDPHGTILPEPGNAENIGQPSQSITERNASKAARET